MTQRRRGDKNDIGQYDHGKVEHGIANRKEGMEWQARLRRSAPLVTWAR
jgi:hypothetical protein